MRLCYFRGQLISSASRPIFVSELPWLIWLCFLLFFFYVFFKAPQYVAYPHMYSTYRENYIWNWVSFNWTGHGLSMYKWAAVLMETNTLNSKLSMWEHSFWDRNIATLWCISHLSFFCQSNILEEHGAQKWSGLVVTPGYTLISCYLSASALQMWATNPATLCDSSGSCKPQEPNWDQLLF